jgi:hypothetical protein
LDHEETPYFRFTEEAERIFLNWRVYLETELRDSNSEWTPMIEAHFAKYRKLVPGLALLHHVTEPDAFGPISEGSIRSVIKYTLYLASHADRIYTSGRNDLMATARLILKKIYHRYLKGIPPPRAAFLNRFISPSLM